MLHHICALLELERPEGPIYVLPNYRGIKFPPFDRDLVKYVRQPVAGDDIQDMWQQARRLAGMWKFYGYPNEKPVLRTTKRPERDLWPYFANQAETIERVVRILEQGRAGLLPRLWALGCVDGYDLVKRKTTASDKRVKAPGRNSNANSKQEKARKAKQPAQPKATSSKKKAVPKPKPKKGETHSPVPSRIEGEQ